MILGYMHTIILLLSGLSLMVSCGIKNETIMPQMEPAYRIEPTPQMEPAYRIEPTPQMEPAYKIEPTPPIINIENDTIFFDSFDANIFRNIKSDDYNAIGNSVNNNMAAYVANENRYYIIDPYEYTNERKIAQGLSYVYLLSDDNLTNKHFSHNYWYKFKTQRDELFFLKGLGDYNENIITASELFSYSKSFGHNRYFDTHSLKNNDSIGIKNYEVTNEDIYFTLSDTDEIRCIKKNLLLGNYIAGDLISHSVVLVDSSTSGFQFASDYSNDYLFYINNGILYRHKNYMHEKILQTNALHFIIDEYFIALDDQNQLNILIADEFITISNDVIAFNKFHEKVYFSTMEGLFSFDTNHVNIERPIDNIKKLIDNNSDIPIDKINICHKKLILKQNFIKIANLDGNNVQFLYEIDENKDEPYSYSSNRQGFSVHFPKGFTTVVDGSYSTNIQLCLLQGGVYISYEDTEIGSLVYSWDDDNIFGITVGKRNVPIDLTQLEGELYTTKNGITGFLAESIKPFGTYGVGFYVPYNFPLQYDNISTASEIEGYYAITGSWSVDEKDYVYEVMKEIIDSFILHKTEQENVLNKHAETAYFNEQYYQPFLNKVWVVENWVENRSDNLSFYITKIENGKIEGIVETYAAYPPIYDQRYYFPSMENDLFYYARNNPNLYGTVSNKVANFSYVSYGTQASIELHFNENNTISATIEYMYKNEWDENLRDGLITYYPYTISDVESEDFFIIRNHTLTIQANMNQWDDVLIVSGENSIGKTVPIVYMTNKQKEILYHFGAPWLHGTDVKEVKVKDLNGDGLMDVIIATQAERDLDIPAEKFFVLNFYQQEDGFFLMERSGFKPWEESNYPSALN